MSRIAQQERDNAAKVRRYGISRTINLVASKSRTVPGLHVLTYVLKSQGEEKANNDQLNRLYGYLNRFGMVLTEHDGHISWANIEK